MIGAGRHILAVACATLLSAGPVAAADDEPVTEEEAAAFLDAWVEDRARIFSDVCMAGAPDFAGLRDRALAAGFEDVDGRLTFQPEVVVSLRGTEDSCACFMTLGAPEPPRMLVGVVERLHADFPGVHRTDERDGPGYYEFYEREGEDVRMTLTVEPFKDLNFVAAMVVAEGACDR